MNENFDPTNSENSIPEPTETAPDSVQPELNTEPEITAESDNIEAEIAPDDNSFEYTDEEKNGFEPVEDEFSVRGAPVNLTPVKRLPVGTSKKGMRVFALLLAGVILLTCGLFGGYCIGKFGTNPISGKSSVSVNLKSAPDGKELSAAALYKKCCKSIVGIQVYNSSSTSSGSGVVFSKDGYIITNDHIYENIASPKFLVFTSDGKEHPAMFVAGDTRSDIAVLKITDSGDYTPAEFGNSDELYIGQNVCAIGCPVNADVAPNLTTGVVSMLNRRLSISSSYAIKYIQTNAALNPGSSGGGLFNMYGQIVGITSAKISGDDYEGLFFSVPTTTVKTVAESLIQNGYVAGRAKLGISYYEVGPAAADASNSTMGLYVAEVSQAADAYGKLDKGDTITAVNDKEINNDDVMLDVIEAAKPNDTVTLTVVTAKGETKTVSVKLAEDKGSSSYNTTQSKSQTPNSDENDSKDKSDDNKNSNPFDFPLGE